MAQRIPAEVFPPGEFIREELEARGWDQNDLAEILGSYPRLVSEIITGKRAITPETAKKLAAALGTSAELWMNLESSYRLWRVKGRDESIARRAKLYAIAPVKEMLRRRWIEHTESAEVLERRVLDFFGIESVDHEPKFWPFAARTSLMASTPAQRAWLFRARRLASVSGVATRFTGALLGKAMAELPLLLHSPEEIRHVPRILAASGIRFLILEHLPQTRIDGACFWLDHHSPVVVLSLRYDRIDAFWHSLMHELEHVRRHDGLRAHQSLDTDLFGDRNQVGRPGLTDHEREVDDAAASSLIASTALDDFIARMKPLFSKQKIQRFAALHHVHPGIVVGQLQHRREIGWTHSREMLLKVRHLITDVALTDGWGQQVTLS